MKQTYLTVTVLMLSVAPVLAGDGGSSDGVGPLIVQAVGRLIGKIAGWF